MPTRCKPPPFFAHYCQMSGYTELQTVIDTITTNPARAPNMPGDGHWPGNRADLRVGWSPSTNGPPAAFAPR